MGTNITGIGNANAIGFKSRVTGGKYVPPELKDALVGVWSAYGKSNDSTDRNIIKNKIKDRGGDFVISNAAFKLNSGFGKYETELSNTRIWTRSKETTSSPFSSNYNGLSGWIVFANTELTNSVDMPSFKIQVKGLLEGQELIYRYYDSTGQTNVYSMTKDGKYTLPADVRTAKPLTSNTSGFQIVKNETNTITITQIPSFEGAFVTDGIDDLITSTKTVQEMLGGSNEITVVSMIHQIKESIYNNCAYTNYISGTNGHIRNQVADTKTGIYGYTVTDLNNSSTNIKGSVINNILGDKNDYLYDANTNVELGNAKYSVQNYIKSDGTVSNIGSQLAWYWTIIANKVLTTDQINQVIAYFNLDRCVDPTVLYDVKRQGLSNDTPDSDWYLKDYSGNGYDMTLYNYAKTPESGINEGGGLQSDGVNDYGKVTGLPIYKDYTVIADYERTDIGNIEGVGTSPVLSKSYTAGQGSFIMNFIASTGNSIRSYSFGTENTSNFNDLARQIFYQSKYKNQGFDITAGTGVDGDSLWLGTARDNDSCFFNGAIYSLMSFPYSMSEFLIERQLKKHKLGTLYPNMVEFRPIVKSNVKWDIIEIWQGDKSLYRPAVNDNKTGIYLKRNSTIGIYVKPYVGQKVSEIVYNGVSYTNLKLNSNGFYYTVVPITKSPQKIGITIEQDENYVLFNPVITSNVEYKNALYYTVTNGVWTRINSGNYINIEERIAIAIFPNGIDELVSVTSSDLNNISTISINNSGEFYYFLANLTSKSPQKINITIYQPPEYLTMLSNSTLISNETLIKNE